MTFHYKYYKCPHCGKRLFMQKMRSGNTFGIINYSDGSWIAPMYYVSPFISKCKECRNFFWTDELEEINIPNLNFNTWGIELDSEISIPILNSENRLVRHAEYIYKLKFDREIAKIPFLEINEYFQAIKKGLGETIDKEILLRREIWWTYNTRIRNNKKLFTSEKDETRWADNVKKLIEILDDSTINNKLMIAELYRNLGSFETSINILNTINNEELNWIKYILIEECKKNNKLVVRLIKSDKNQSSLVVN